MYDIFRVWFASGLFKGLKLINGSRFYTNFVNFLAKPFFSPLTVIVRAQLVTVLVLTFFSQIPLYPVFTSSIIATSQGYSCEINP